MPNILAFAASTRSGSFNQAALEVAAEGARESWRQRHPPSTSRTTPSLSSIRTSKRPMDSPPPFLALREIFAAHDAILVAVPEYNGFFPPLYKNTLDWLSRPAPDDSPDPFADKSAAVISASPGGLGGMRGLPHAKLLLQNLGILVLPQSPRSRWSPLRLQRR